MMKEICNGKSVKVMSVSGHDVDRPNVDRRMVDKHQDAKSTNRAGCRHFYLVVTLNLKSERHSNVSRVCSKYCRKIDIEKGAEEQDTSNLTQKH